MVVVGSVHLGPVEADDPAFELGDQEAIWLERGLTIAGWVANQVDPAMLRFDQNLEALKARMPAPLLGVVHFQPDGNAAAAAASLELPLPA